MDASGGLLFAWSGRAAFGPVSLPVPIEQDIQRTVIDRVVIERRVRELAKVIVRDFQALSDRPAGLVLVPVMSGSLVFTADLIRRLPIRLEVRLVALRSYHGTSTTPAPLVASIGELPTGLGGRHVLVIDDVLDSGRTMAFIERHVRMQNPADVRLCVLLRKQKPHAVEAQYVGFDIDDEFVVGYGLDYDGRYRNWPDIVTLTPEAMNANL